MGEEGHCKCEMVSAQKDKEQTQVNSFEWSGWSGEAYVDKNRKVIN